MENTTGIVSMENNKESERGELTEPWQQMTMKTSRYSHESSRNNIGNFIFFVFHRYHGEDWYAPKLYISLFYFLLLLEFIINITLNLIGS